MVSHGPLLAWTVVTAAVVVHIQPSYSWSPPSLGSIGKKVPQTRATTRAQFSTLPTTAAAAAAVVDPVDSSKTLNDFVDFLQIKQLEIIRQIEDLEASYGSKAVFANDPWGVFLDTEAATAGVTVQKSGGKTRVLQGGTVVEKGACSLTFIRDGTLTAERARTIQSRQVTEKDDNESTAFVVRPGDKYSAAALSMVLHSRHPMVPTFRSDVRIFQVRSSDNNGKTLTWFGGGADLTPYYLFDSDITFFHTCYRDLIHQHNLQDIPGFSYSSQKNACDDYFYLPARSEHRGTGGIFFDDLEMNQQTMTYVKGVVETWMPSWFPIVRQRQEMDFTEQEKHWQLLRRGRYLEFNLLYDRGVKFGLANANPRTEGVMVSAPPVIAYEYNHKIEPGSREEQLMKILKEPREWVDEK